MRLLKGVRLLEGVRLIEDLRYVGSRFRARHDKIYQGDLSRNHGVPKLSTVPKLGALTLRYIFTRN